MARRLAPTTDGGFRQHLGRFLIRARWPLVVLYGLCVIALYVFPLVVAAGGEPESLYFYIPLVVGLGLQILFCYARGDAANLQPVTFKRSWLVLTIGGFLAAILAVGAACALGELLYLDQRSDWGGYLALIFFGSWIVWTLFFALIVMNLSRLSAIRRILLCLISGSLLQLTTTISAHMLVMRRGGCLVGLATAFGITCGAAVLIWAFGPGIFLLFYYEMRNRRGGYCLGCGYSLRGLTEMRCPECGRAFTLREANMSAAGFENPR